MFNNPGQKLKMLAKILFWLLLIPSIIWGISVMSLGSLGGTRLGTAGFLVGLGIIVAGIGTAWLSSILLYAIGSAIDDIQTIKEITVRTYEKNYPEDVHTTAVAGNMGENGNYPLLEDSNEGIVVAKRVLTEEQEKEKAAFEALAGPNRDDSVQKNSKDDSVQKSTKKGNKSSKSKNVTKIS